jgi:hypothetical protein
MMQLLSMSGFDTLHILPAIRERQETYEAKKPKLLDQVRHALRAKHYSIHTEEAYLHWIKRFILYHNKRHPREMNSPEIEQFLTHLAVEQNVAASTQNPCTELVEVRPWPPFCFSTKSSSVSP